MIEYTMIIEWSYEDFIHECSKMAQKGGVPAFSHCTTAVENLEDTNILYSQFWQRPYKAKDVEIKIIIK